MKGTQLNHSLLCELTARRERTFVQSDPAAEKALSDSAEERMEGICMYNSCKLRPITPIGFKQCQFGFNGSLPRFMAVALFLFSKF